MSDDHGPEEGDTALVQIEIGPPKYTAVVTEKARRGINATDEYLGYEPGEYVDKVVLEGKLEVTDVYRKEL